MPEMHLKQVGMTYSACENSSKQEIRDVIIKMT